MYKNLNEEHAITHTMEVHQGKEGWYYTIHQDGIFILQSADSSDRVEVTQAGLKHLELFRQTKVINNGQ